LPSKHQIKKIIEAKKKAHLANQKSKSIDEERERPEWDWIKRYN